MADFSKVGAELRSVFTATFKPPPDYNPPMRGIYAVWTNHGQIVDDGDPILAIRERAWRTDQYMNALDGILWQFSGDELRQVRELATAIAKQYGYDLGKEIYKKYLHVSTIITSNEVVTDGGLTMLVPEEKSVEKPIDTLNLNDLAIINAARERELRAAGLIGAEQNHFLENREAIFTQTNLPNKTPIKQDQKPNKIKSAWVGFWGIILSKEALHNASGTVMATSFLGLIGICWAALSFDSLKATLALLFRFLKFIVHLFSIG